MKLKNILLLLGFFILSYFAQSMESQEENEILINLEEDDVIWIKAKEILDDSSEIQIAINSFEENDTNSVKFIKQWPLKRAFKRAASKFDNFEKFLLATGFLSGIFIDSSYFLGLALSEEPLSPWIMALPTACSLISIFIPGFLVMHDYFGCSKLGEADGLHISLIIAAVIEAHPEQALDINIKNFIEQHGLVEYKKIIKRIKNYILENSIIFGFH